MPPDSLFLLFDRFVCVRLMRVLHPDTQQIEQAFRTISSIASFAIRSFSSSVFPLIGAVYCLSILDGKPKSVEIFNNLFRFLYISGTLCINQYSPFCFSYTQGHCARCILFLVFGVLFLLLLQRCLRREHATCEMRRQCSQLDGFFVRCYAFF